MKIKETDEAYELEVYKSGVGLTLRGADEESVWFDQEQAKELLPLIKAYAETGELPE
ncbi:hypothetical protein G6K69_004284 [Salmonella enterica subsp. enterica serovar Rubislaw]|nr:hypothetical protein [Salmonella enterica subsp. enterica serovar Rubislaw]